MRHLIVLLPALALCGSLTAQTPCINGSAGGFPCQNIDLMARLTPTQLGLTSDLSDIWGWTDPVTGKEYAIVGGLTGTAFVDVTVPTAPVVVGKLPAHNNSSSYWRDVDVHGNWCFVGSEAPNHGIQVFDLTRLRNVTSPPQTFTADARYSGVGSSHTIFADKTEPYVYVVGASAANGGLVVLNVSNPLNPTLAGTFSQEGYIHENTVFTYHGPDTQHTGKKISFNFHINANDRVTIVDVTDKTDMELIATTPPYTVPSLCHQGWLTEDHRYLLMNDEGDEQTGNYNTRTHIFDLLDLDAPVYIGYSSGPNPSYDHNLYVHKGLAWAANYTSGLHIMDVANVASASLPVVALFDTYPTNNGRSYNGAWGNYPFFASGTIVVSSINEGLFVLRPRTSLRLRAMLEGPYDPGTGMMHDSLRTKGLLPTQEPYTALGYAHVGGGGETVSPNVFNTTGPNAIVDWVVVELRDAEDPSIVLATRSALLQRDGDIVGTDGTSPVQFDLAVGDHHIAVRHRNHLGIMTAAPVRVSVAERTYDLSDGSVALYGTEATRNVNGRRLLWNGNTRADAELLYTGAGNDRDPILVRVGGVVPTNTVQGYHVEDVNMDGTVRYTGARNDRDPILSDIGGVVPTSTRQEQLP
jgi:choice-of-anchor B domain-containing protein